NRRWRHDGAVRLRTDSDSAETRCRSGSAPGARAQWTAIQNIWIAALAAPRTPSARRALATKVRPFAEIGFTDDDRAGIPQSFGDDRFSRRNGAFEGQRTGRCCHRTDGIDVVFEEYRN